VRRTLLSLFCATVVVFLASATASADTFYVAPSPAGSDTNAGTEAAPFATIQKAADVAFAGDTVVVMPGTYAGAQFTTSGTAEAPIVVRGMEGAVVASPGPRNSNFSGLWIFGAAHIVIENFEVHSVDGCGIIASASVPPEEAPAGIVIRDNYVHDTGFGGICVNTSSGAQVLDNEIENVAGLAAVSAAGASDNLLISGNVIHGNALGGIQLTDSPTSAVETQLVTVAENTLYENGAGGFAAVSLRGVKNSLVANNLLYGNLGRGIELVAQESGNGSLANRVFNNTVVQAAEGGAPLAVLGASFNNSAFNNILVPPASVGSVEVDSASRAGLQVDFNAVFGPMLVDGGLIPLASWQALGYDTSSIAASPGAIFVDAAGGNYDLKADSTAIDKGRFVTGVTVDIRGVPRPQGAAYDIGAYEYFVPDPENQNPVASAGADRTVDIGDVVQLDGRGSSDPDGDPLAFMWVQTSGPAVALTGAGSSVATFTAPEVVEETTLTFQLTVDDGRGGTATDSVTITVEPPPLPKITVFAPAGGESWKKKTKKKIRWVADAGVSGDARIELSRDGGQTFEVIIPSVNVLKGKKGWTVKGATTTTALVRVVLISDPRIQGTSPNVFTIRK
jgi:hypothetical protein